MDRLSVSIALGFPCRGYAFRLRGVLRSLTVRRARTSRCDLCQVYLCRVLCQVRLAQVPGLRLQGAHPGSCVRLYLAARSSI
jgi:hypothetical protein